MAKELETQVKLQVPAGSANPAPPVGPALGQHGLNIQDFCKHDSKCHHNKIAMILYDILYLSEIVN